MRVTDRTYKHAHTTFKSPDIQLDLKTKQYKMLISLSLEPNFILYTRRKQSEKMLLYIEFSRNENTMCIEGRLYFVLFGL